MLHATALSANPLVAIYDNVFDADLAEKIIAAGSDDQGPSGVITPLGATQSDARTNTTAVIDQWMHPDIAALCTKIAGIVRLPPENCESAKVLRYEGDQQFKPHLDGYTTYLPGSADPLAAGGQRLFTTLCYLNDVEADGGRTDFPALKLSVRPKLGRVLLFSNTVPGTIDVHPHSAHAGRPVTSGVKWVMSLWWRQHLFHVPRHYPEEQGETRVI